MDNRKKKILEALEKYNGIISVACTATQFSRSTFYSWLNSDEEFKTAVDDIQEIAIDFVESKLFEKITGVKIGKETGEGVNVYDTPPSDTAIIFYLKTKGKKRGYIEKTETEVTGKDGAALITINYNNQPGNEPLDASN